MTGQEDAEESALFSYSSDFLPVLAKYRAPMMPTS
jgi:hypothetical protein